MTFRLLHLFKNGVSIINRKSVVTLPTATRPGLQLRRTSIVATSQDFTLEESPGFTGFSVNAFASGLPTTIAMNAQTARDMVALQSIFGVVSSLDQSKQSPKDQLRLQYLRDSEVVFLSVDLEAYEFAQEKITEVGVSILDSRDIVGTEAGLNGALWLSKINTRHFIIKEYRHLVNKRFVHGCPDKFDFGESEVVSLKAIRDTLIEIFKHPAITKKPGDDGPRKIILVGHGLSNDTTFLKTLGFSPHSEGNILQSMDTQRLAGSTKRKTVALRKMLAGLLGTTPENLHNAGNDAAWTLRGLVMMVAKHTEEPEAYLKAISSVSLAPEAEKQRYKNARKAIQNRHKSQAQGQAPQPYVSCPGDSSRMQNQKAGAKTQIQTPRKHQGSVEEPIKEPSKESARNTVKESIKGPVGQPVERTYEIPAENVSAAVTESVNVASKNEERRQAEMPPRSRAEKAAKGSTNSNVSQLTTADSQKPVIPKAKSNGDSENKDEHKNKPAKRRRTGKGPETNDKIPDVAKVAPNVKEQGQPGNLANELEHRTIGEHKQRRRKSPTAPPRQGISEPRKSQKMIQARGCSEDMTSRFIHANDSISL